MDVDGVEDRKEREAPRDAVDDGRLALREELVDDGAEQEEVDEGPDAESVVCGREVGLFAGAVGAFGSCDAVDVGAEEEEVHDYVGYLGGGWVNEYYV